jgi:hypothetical protein
MSKPKLDLSPRDRPSPREHMMTVRVNDQERAILEALSEITEISISDIFRSCINGPVLQALGETRPDIYKMITNEEFTNEQESD